MNLDNLNKRTQKEEMTLAATEKRQPHCVYCLNPLDQVAQTQFETIVWHWDGERYLKSTDGDSNPPYCPNCDAQDWAFVDNNLVTY